MDDGKPTSVEVTLPCPDCGESITNHVVTRFDSDALSGGYYLAFDSEYPVTNHRCPPVQMPDEPTEAGVKITFGDARLISTDRNDDGLRIFTNVDNGSTLTWLDITWIATDHGTQITLGWDE